MSEWQPIETAPKDVEILVCSTDTYDICHVIKSDEGISAVGDGGPFNGATHWMPLPSPPK